jgi:hypothetical protein
VLSHSPDLAQNLAHIANIVHRIRFSDLMDTFTFRFHSGAMVMSESTDSGSTPPAEMYDHSPRLDLLASGGTLLLICVVYLFVGSGFTFRYPVTPFQTGDYFGLLADSFLQGRTDLMIPGPRLDMSLFEGKIYLYWGPANALLPMAAKAAGLNLAATLYTVLYACAAVALLLLLFREVRRTWFVDLPSWPDGQLLFNTALCSPLVYVAGRADWIYHRSITLSVALQTATLLFFVRAVQSSGSLSVLLFGLCFGLALAARSTAILLLPGLILVAVYLMGWKPAVRRFAAAVPVVVAFGIGLMTYNYVRFGKVSEPGFTYTVLEPQAHRQILFDNNIILSPLWMQHNFYKYFLRLPPLDQFPPKTAQIEEMGVPAGMKHLLIQQTESVEGYSILFMNPAFLIPILLLFVSRKSQAAQVTAAFVFSLLLYIIFLLNYYSTAYRFIADILPVWMIAGYSSLQLFLRAYPRWRKSALCVTLGVNLWALIMFWPWGVFSANKINRIMIRDELAHLPWIDWGRFLFAVLCVWLLSLFWIEWRRPDGAATQPVSA